MNRIKLFGMSILILLVVVLSMSNVFALGVAPSREIIDFKEGIQNLEVRIINNDREDMRIAIYPKGPLAEYATITDDLVLVSQDEAEKTVKYSLNLPADLDPGTQELGIVMVQLPDTFANTDENLIITDEKSILFENKDQNSMISATTAVIHQLQVRVPYPESHLEGRLYVSEGKVGDTLTFTVPVVNRGTSTAQAWAEIIIKGPTNEEIETIRTETQSIEGGKEVKLVGEWLAEVNEGKYIAEAIVHYGDKVFTLNKEFRVGNIFVSIEDMSVTGFKLGGIAKFDVDIKNKWNQDINDVYGELKILDEQGQSLSTVKTLSTDLSPFGEDTLNGYWDTTGIEVGRYDVNVILNYAGKTTEKLFQTIVSIDKITVGTISAGKVTGTEGDGGSLMSILIIVVIVLVAVNIGWFVFFRKKMKKPPT